MRTLYDVSKTWELFLAKYSTLSDLRDTIRDHGTESPCSTGLRSICWKAFLLFDSLERSTWPKTLADSRGAYTSLKEHFLRNLEHGDELDTAVDPLTEDEKSPWVAIRRDEALRDEILLDIDRCMPENLYFRQPETQKLMLDILFTFCKLNQDVGYRQGMHELLAPILWVVEKDAIKPSGRHRGQTKVREEDLLLKISSPEYIEHDAFTLFSLIMQTAKSFYELGGQEGCSEATTKEHSSASKNHSPIIERSRLIHEDYLARVDPELATRLKEIEILPQIFLIRWIRLLFGREFLLDDLLAMWDTLFAEEAALILVDYVCVAMLLRIRWQLIAADYSTALALLLHYPSPAAPHGPSTLVQDAVYLRHNTSFDGGVHIIQKYSHKKPSNRYRRHEPSQRPSTPTLRQNQASRANIPFLSAGTFFKQQGGVEGILQDAAKGVYSRGEKWGVTRVVREAVGEVRKNVQEFQQGGSTQRNLLRGRNPEEIERLNALEKRNHDLATMLEESLSELRSQQKALKAQSTVNFKVVEAIDVAVAKIQFVQFYLEDPMLPISLPAEAKDSNQPAHIPRPSSPLVIQAQPSKPAEPMASEVSNLELPSKDAQPTASVREKSRTPLTKQSSLAETPATSSITTRSQSKVEPTLSQPAEPFPFHRPRPSLTQSSFSWMLGEDQRRSSFVSSSPFPADRRRESAAPGQTGALFGDGAHGKAHVSKVHNRKTENEDDEGFSLGSLPGDSMRS